MSSTDNNNNNVGSATIGETTTTTGTTIDFRGNLMKYGISNMDDVRSLFIGSKLSVPIAKTILTSEFTDEASVLFYVFLNSVDLHSTAKVSMLAAAFDLKMYEYAKTCLNTNKFTFVEILKCLKIMDSKRVIKKLEKKISNIQASNQVRKEKLDKITTDYVLSKYPEITGEEREGFLKKLLKRNAPFPKLDKAQENETSTTDTAVSSSRPSRGGRPARGRGGRSTRGRGGKPARGGRSTRGRGGRTTTTRVVEEVDSSSSNNNTETEDKAVEELSEKLKKTVVISDDVKEKMKSKQSKEAVLNSRLKKGLAFVENKLKELKSHQYESSLSGNVIKIFKKWFSSVDKATLEFFALGQPKETWVKIADLLHLSPKDFPSMTWFLSYMHGGSAPENSIVKDLENSEQKSDEELVALWEKYRPPYSFIRKSLGERKLTDQMKLAIAKYESLNTLIWWLHEFKSQEITELIIERLASGETIDDIALGTLIEKALLNSDLPVKLYDQLMKVTNSKLDSFQAKFSLPPPISIFSDKSGSMQVAIRLAIIVSFMITKLTPDSELCFFDTKNHVSPITPTSVNDIVTLNSSVHASGGTTPAASLYELFKNKISKRYIVMVTDEEENGTVAGSLKFAALYKEYVEKVCKECKLIFISFLGVNEKGQMMGDLKKVMELEPLQFVLDKNKPDVTKIDAMLSVLSAESDQFKGQFSLLMKYRELFGEKHFFQYISEKRSKLLTYALNTEIITDILSVLYKFQNEQLTEAEQKEHSFFISKMSKDLCVETINSLNQQLINNMSTTTTSSN